MATFYVCGGGNQNAATFTSVGIAFTTFTGIIIYHSVQQIKGTRLFKRMFLLNYRQDYRPIPGANTPEDPPDVVYVPGSAPTQTFVDIRDSQLREPCMAD